MKAVLFFLFFLLAGANGQATPKQSHKTKVTYAYICNSNTSVAYHASQDCRGLNRCTHVIIRTTLDSAVNYYGKRACKICE